MAVPRAAPPGVLPLPFVDRAEQERERTADRARAELARQTGLPFEVRAVGESFRRYGRAEAEHDEALAKSQLVMLERTLLVTRQRHLDGALLALRAVQTELFTNALSTWEKDGKDSLELAELGGTFLHNARAFAWVEAPGRLALSRAEREILFKARWTEVLRLRDSRPFSLSLNEWRSYYRTLLEHPQAPADAQESRARAALGYVAALRRRDSDYPAELANGVLKYRSGDYAGATRSLSEYLSTHETGPWTMRARNHLIFVAKQGALEDPP